eukprot:gene7072-14383_t
MFYSQSPAVNSLSSQLQQTWNASSDRQSSNTRAKSRRQTHASRGVDKSRDKNETVGVADFSVQGNRKATVGFASLRLDQEEKNNDEEMPRLKTPQIGRSHNGLSSPKEGNRETPAGKKGSANRHSSGTRGSRRSKHGGGDSSNDSGESSPVQSTQLPQISGAGTGGRRPQSTSGNGALHIVTEEHATASINSIKGLKPGNPNWTNQDNFLVIERFDNRDVNIYCVLDGHGESGHLVSRKCRENFPQHIRTAGLDMKRAFSLMQSDLNASDIDVRCSGATCVMVTHTGNRLEVSNCGDSRAVLGRKAGNGQYTAIALTNDHKPDKPEERKRILSCGGHLGCRQVLVNQGPRGPVTVPVGPTRVWYQYRGDTLGLAMSRSLGDSVVHRSGVSAEPEIIEHTIDYDLDDFLIIATDGIWDVVDNTQAVQMIQTFANKGLNWNTTEASAWLCKFARSRWEKMSPMVDDITCIIIKLGRGK